MAEEKLIRTTTQLSSQAYEKLREISYTERRSIANLIREAIDRYLDSRP